MEGTTTNPGGLTVPGAAGVPVVATPPAPTPAGPQPMAVDPPADPNLPSGLSATPGAGGQNPPPAAVTAQQTTAGATTSQGPPAGSQAGQPPAPPSTAAAARPSFVDRLMAREFGWSPEFLQQYRQELTRLRAAIPPPPEALAFDGGHAGVTARDFGTPAWNTRYAAVVAQSDHNQGLQELAYNYARLATNSLHLPVSDPRSERPEVPAAAAAAAAAPAAATGAGGGPSGSNVPPAQGPGGRGGGHAGRGGGGRGGGYAGRGGGGRGWSRGGNHGGGGAAGPSHGGGSSAGPSRGGGAGRGAGKRGTEDGWQTHSNKKGKAETEAVVFSNFPDPRGGTFPKSVADLALKHHLCMLCLKPGHFTDACPHRPKPGNGGGAGGAAGAAGAAGAVGGGAPNT